MKKIMLFAAACVALAACSKEIDTTSLEIGDGSAFVKGQNVTLSISAGDQTKVSSSLDGTTGAVDFKWETDDKIKVTVGTKSAEFTLKSGAGESTATFEGIMPEGGTAFNVQYPVNDVTDADLIEQTYVANGLPKDKMKMTATDCTLDTPFSLKPQYSALRLNLWGGQTVSKIVVVLKTETTDQSYTLDCGTTGVTVGATRADSTNFFIVVPAGSYKFSAEVFDNTETPASIFNLETSAAKTFTAGKILNMSAKEVINPSKYLCFTCTSGNVAIGMTKKSNTISSKTTYAPDISLQYYTDKTGWQDFKLGDGKGGVNDSTSIALAPGEKVCFKAKTTNDSLAVSAQAHNCFTTTGKGTVDVSGNIMSLLDGENPGTTLTHRSAFSSLFKNCTSIQSASGLSLPATTLARLCYCSMFKGCTALVSAPLLPATTLAYGCYQAMFEDCTALKTAPTLPATTLADNCYYFMFQGCTALKTAPTLPVTTLANGCYSYMFKDCIALETAPTLPATTLAEKCYSTMFRGCSKLSSVTMLATNVEANKCLYDWLKDAGTQGSTHILYVDPTMTGNSIITGSNGNFTVTAYSGN